jgi:uncharacterized protein YmfQ (DUF2313 family)
MALRLFQAHTDEEHTDALGSYLLDGPLFRAKRIPGTKMRQLLEGFAIQLRLAEEKTEIVWEEMDINETTLLIEEWEAFVGIPDDCFDQLGTLEERRRNILVKLNSSIQTADDFVALADLFGITITVTPGYTQQVFPMTFPFVFFGSDKESRFSMIIDFPDDPIDEGFPYTFPFVFPEDSTVLIRCLFEKLKPTNVNIIYTGL